MLSEGYIHMSLLLSSVSPAGHGFVRPNPLGAFEKSPLNFHIDEKLLVETD